MVLLRHLLGDALRRLRQRQGRTLREVSAAARVSLGYLSEVERGQKEASSELLAAICSALGAPLSQVFREVSDNFALAELQNEPVLAGAREPALDAPAAVGPAVGMDTSGAPQAFGGAAQPIRLASGRPGTGAVLDPVQLPPGRTAAFDDEVARRIRDVTDMIPV
jgi:transcriptional regulator with XRE-family HTH domain